MLRGRTFRGIPEARRHWGFSHCSSGNGIESIAEFHRFRQDLRPAGAGPAGVLQGLSGCSGEVNPRVCMRGRCAARTLQSCWSTQSSRRLRNQWRPPGFPGGNPQSRTSVLRADNGKSGESSLCRRRVQHRERVLWPHRGGSAAGTVAIFAAIDWYRPGGRGMTGCWRCSCSANITARTVSKSRFTRWGFSDC